jgi:hypothetical protein
MMAISDNIGMGIGTVRVVTTTNGGRPPEFFAERIMDKLMYVDDRAPEPIKSQALEYQLIIREIILAGIKAAIESDRHYRK